MKMVRSILACDAELSNLQAPQLTQFDISTLQDMLNVLELFEESTDLVQGDKIVTISCILPAIRGLREDMSAYNNSYNGKLVAGLFNSINKRLAAYEDN